MRTKSNHYKADSNERLLATVESRSPFFERLVSFWSDHFTVSVKNPGVRILAGPYEVEAIRPHVMGNFRDLLRAVELHPAMIVYLDLSRSVGPNSPVAKRLGERSKGLNENLAREILELHTIGVAGGYSQADVTSFAKIMTGWTINREEGGARFNPRRAEPGSHMILGVPVGSNGPSADNYPQALDILARHPSTAKFIAAKLVRHFIDDEPQPDYVGVVEKAFVESSGHLPSVYRVVASLPDTWKKVGSKARTDFEYVVASLRAARVGAKELAARERGQGKRSNPLSVGALDTMAQPLWRAPSPAGWPDRADDWLSPTGLAQRLQWIPQVIGFIPDRTAEEFLDRVLGPVASEQTRSVVRAASNREEGLSLVLASPEFNRR